MRGPRRPRATGCGYDAHPPANEFGCQCRQPIVAAVRPAIFDRHVPALDMTGLASGPGGTRATERVSIRRRGAEKPDHRHRRLLRPRRERPRRRRAAEQRDELAPLHSITSSARASRVGGTSRPSALAVLRLITSSNLVGCSIGKSAGFAPVESCRRNRQRAEIGPGSSAHRQLDLPFQYTRGWRGSSAVLR